MPTKIDRYLWHQLIEYRSLTSHVQVLKALFFERPWQRQIAASPAQNISNRFPKCSKQKLLLYNPSKTAVLHIWQPEYCWTWLSVNLQLPNFLNFLNVLNTQCTETNLQNKENPENPALLLIFLAITTLWHHLSSTSLCIWDHHPLESNDPGSLDGELRYTRYNIVVIYW